MKDLTNRHLSFSEEQVLLSNLRSLEMAEKAELERRQRLAEGNATVVDKLTRIVPAIIIGAGSLIFLFAVIVALFS